MSILDNLKIAKVKCLLHFAPAMLISELSILDNLTNAAKVNVLLHFVPAMLISELSILDNLTNAVKVQLYYILHQQC